MTAVAGLQGLIIRFALRFRGIVLALSVLFVVYGVSSLGEAGYDAFPEFASPQVTIQTEAPGLSSEQVETLVTRPIEMAVNGAPYLRRMVSISIPGLSQLTVYFDASSDVYRDRQQVAERLATAIGQLPTGVQPPTMTPLTSSMATILVIGLTSPTQSLMQLRAIAKWTIRPALLSVPGVAGAEIFGGDERATQILVHPERLVRFGVSMEEVVAAARQATGVRGAGFIATPNQRITLHAEGQSARPSDIARTVVAQRDGGRVTLADVADIVEAPEPAIGAAAVNGQPGVVLNIDEQYGANTLDVTKGIDAALAELQPILQQAGVMLHASLFRPANFITAAIGSLRSALVIGAVMVAIVLFLFLFDLRAAAICCTAIPISLLVAVVVVEQFGVTLNTMTLGGLAIALGEVVDDAVIGIENITRRLRENRRLAEPLPPFQVVLQAAFEVRSAVVYATFAVILVFLPVVFLSGTAGRLFAPLGLTYVFAVLASLGVALTLTPALALLLLPQHTGESERDPPLVRWLRGRYERVLRRGMKRPRLAIAGAAVVTLAGVGLLPLFGATFLPELQERHFIVHMTAMPGTSLDESLRMGVRVTAALQKLPIVRSVGLRVGRAELAAAGDTHGSHQSELEVELKPLPGSETRAAKAAILEQLEHFPGVNLYANTFLGERIYETFSGYTAPVAVNVYGSDLARIDETAHKVAEVLRDIRGAKSVELQSPPGLPRLVVALRRDDLEHRGLTLAQVLDAIRIAYQGDVVGQTYEGDRVYNVIVKLAQPRQGNMADIGNLPIRAADGVFVPLRLVADIEASSGLYQIRHQGGRRLQAVTLDVQGRDLASFVQEAKRQVAAKVSLPEGTYLAFTGAAEGQARAQRDLALKSLFAGVGIVLLLSVVTRDWRNLLIILANLPFTLVGGVVAAFLSDRVLSLGSLVGFVTLFGITLRNSMMMVAHYEHLVEIDGRPWNLETAVLGAADRLAAVLMTSLVTGLGLLPLAVEMDMPGREIEGPMALVILGGLFTSAVLNLLILPILALRYGRFAPPIVDYEPVAARKAAE